MAWGWPQSNYSIVGAFSGSRAQRGPQDSAAPDEQILKCVAQGRLRPYISRTLLLGEFREALHTVADCQAQGRVDLLVRLGTSPGSSPVTLPDNPTATALKHINANQPLGSTRYRAYPRST